MDSNTVCRLTGTFFIFIQKRLSHFMKKIATIRLCNLIFYGYHGVLAEEKSLGQRFEVDLEYQFDSTAIRNDQLNETISYVDVYNLVNDALTQKTFNLLEMLGNHIVDEIRSRFPVTQVRIRIRKPSVPIPGVLDHVEVEISRGPESE
ncbi:MAG: dihydroneopterin aldolase [SAR324 cluster bacterium]|nr:dihydroneopterin aldolase [SAR324 cluster bacterium]